MAQTNPKMADPITAKALKPTLEALLREAKQAGATHADTLATHGRSAAITVRDGDLEDIDNSESRDIGLRVFVGRRQACVSSSDVSPASLTALAQRAVAMAKLAPEDPYCGLAGLPDLSSVTDGEGMDLYDPSELSPAELKARALKVEAAAKSVKGVMQAEGANASAASAARYFMTSHGFEGGWQSSHFGLSVAAIAEKDGAMERDYDFANARWLEDLRSPEAIGQLAGERTVARLGAKQLPSSSLPVMFDRRVSGALIGSLLGAISGTAITRGVSFLKDKLGEPIFGSHINIIDDPTLKRGYSSKPFDGEGVATKRWALIENGALTTWLLNTASAKQLDLKTTGHASRGISTPPGVSATNTFMEAGAHSPEALMSNLSNGLLVTEMFGPSLNANTGDYSVGVAGFHIENGTLGSPVTEVTLAGNLLEVFKHMTPANDLVFDAATVAPSLLCEGLTLAGS